MQSRKRPECERLPGGPWPRRRQQKHARPAYPVSANHRQRLAPADCHAEITGDLAPIADRVEGRRPGGGSLSRPLGGHPLLVAVIDGIQPTPFQRSFRSPPQALIRGDRKIGRFLDPVIAVTAPNGGFWTPNGLHRLEAMPAWARSITALILPERDRAPDSGAEHREGAQSKGALAGGDPHFERPGRGVARRA